MISEINNLNPEIQALLTSKATADALPPEIRNKYAEKYNWVVAGIVQYGLFYPLPSWDEEVNSEILRYTLWDIGQKYDHKKPYIEWMCQRLVPEVDISFQTKDQNRFYQCIQVARQQIRNV